jgi:hypothetical protein
MGEGVIDVSRTTQPLWKPESAVGHLKIGTNTHHSGINMNLYINILLINNRIQFQE